MKYIFKNNYPGLISRSKIITDYTLQVDVKQVKFFLS